MIFATALMAMVMMMAVITVMKVIAVCVGDHICPTLRLEWRLDIHDFTT